MPAGLWNPAPENIGTGWPGPPQYNAPNIGSLVGDILKNRQFEQLNMQNQISGLGKAIQAQQQNQAFGEQASNAGLLPGVDTSNMNVAQTAALAKLIQEQGTEAATNAYKQALGTWISQDKPLAGGRGGGAGGANTVSVYGNDGSYLGEFPTQSKIAQDYLRNLNPNLRPQDSPTQVNTLLRPYPGLTPNDVTDPTRIKGFQYSADGNSLVPLNPDQTYDEDATHVQVQPSTPGSPAITMTRDEFERLKQGIIGPSYTPNTAPPMPQGTVNIGPGASPSPAPTMAPQTGGRVMPNASTGAPVNTPRDAAIAELQKAGMPVTEANIQAAIGQLNFGQ